MGLWPTRGDESRCHPEPVRFAQGKLREGSAVPVRGELMQILRFTQNDKVEAFCRNFMSADPSADLPTCPSSHLPTCLAYFPLDILPEGRYSPLVCLPKNSKNVLNFCKEPWTC